MRARLTVIVLLLVVLPTAVLSLLARRAFRSWELVLQDQVESAAARAIQSVWKQMHAEMQEEVMRASRAMSASLERSGEYEDAATVAQAFAMERSLVDGVCLFMHPWGLLYPQGEQAEGRLRPGWDFPPKSQIDAGGNATVGLLSRAVMERIDRGDFGGRVTGMDVGGCRWCFSRLDSGRDLYVGVEIDRAEFGRRLSAALARFSGGAFVLLADAGKTPNALPVEESHDGVVVTDTFSPLAVSPGQDHGGGTVRVALSHTGLDPGDSSLSALAEARLFEPFHDIRVTALARDPEELSRTGALQARLYVWGVLLLAVGIIIGAGFVLREAVTEIRLARAKSDFAIGVSHDLRTPVASMKMLAESLFLEHVPDKEKQKEFLGTIVRECERLSQLIERVLFLVRFGQDALVYRPQPADPGELVRAAVDTFNARRTGLQVALEIEENLPRVDVDTSAMTQVILNLLDNAAKYGVGGPRDHGTTGPQDHGTTGPRDRGSGTGGRGKIRVAVGVAEKHRRGMVRVAVSDDGPGIEASELKRIFRPFHRGPGAADSNTSGVGLGLAMCRRIVSAHGGRIEVESEEGAGSTFAVFLPAA